MQVLCDEMITSDGTKAPCETQWGKREATRIGLIAGGISAMLVYSGCAHGVGCEVSQVSG